MMSRPGGKSSLGLMGFMPIAQSRRWNRQPIPTGPSDDDRTGGGVSLTALSATDDSTATSSRLPISDDKGKKPATPSNTLRGDAKSFEPRIPETSTGSTGFETSPTSPTSVESDSLKSSASQPCTTTVVQPAGSGEGNTVQDAAVDLMMKSYYNSRHRSHSARSRQGERIGDVDYDCRENGLSTTHSSPIKAVTRDNAPIVETKADESGDENYISDTQKQVGNKMLCMPDAIQYDPPVCSLRFTNQRFRNGNTGLRLPLPVTGDTSVPYNQQGPSTYATNYKPYQEQARNTLTPYGSKQQNEDVYQDQLNQLLPARITGYPPQDQVAGNGISMMPSNRGTYQMPKTDNGSFSVVNRYKHGASLNRSVLQYYNNEQFNPSMGLIPIDRKPTTIQQTVDPMDLETPHKEIMADRSEMLQALTENGQPSLNDLLDPRFLPFTEIYKLAFPSEENGVIAIRNIPYETTRGEIIALLGKSSKILNDRHEPVHIIMDRVTSKTQDAYCELSSLNAAIELVDRFKRGAENGRTGRLGSRIVDVELSSQTNLMLALFPSTINGVTWIGPNPQVITGSTYPWEDFKGFFTEEEMIMLSKHVENPQRSLFAKICPERPYECMISTLRKIPWYKAEHITIKQRHSVYDATLKMIVTLSTKVNRGDFKNNTETERLTPQLFGRLVTAAMLCPGFSVVQKHNIATVAGLPESKSREFNQPRFPDSWRHQWTLAPRPGMPIDVLEWYIAVIRAETNRVVQSLVISQRRPLEDMMQGVDGYWGFFWAEANFPTGCDWDNLSLAACSQLEWQAIERIVTRAIQGGNIPPSYTSQSNHINSTFTNGPPQIIHRRY